MIADANEAFLRAAGRTREELLGRSVSDAFPEDSPDPGATGARSSAASLRRVLATGEPDPLELHEHGIEVSPGMSVKRYWSCVIAPVSGPDGSAVLIVSCGENVTGRLNRVMSALDGNARQLTHQVAGKRQSRRPGSRVCGESPRHRSG